MNERITSLDEIEDAERFLNAHYKALDELRSMRAELKTAQSELETLNADGGKYKSQAIRQAVKSALEQSGIKDADRIIKYMSIDELDFDESDALVGLDAKLEEVKSDFPELFDTKRRAGRSSADIHAKTTATVKRDTTDAQLDALFN